MPLTTCPAELLSLAHRLADASGEVIRRYFRAPFTVEGKADMSPVTVADRKAEEAIRAILTKERPNDGIVGEEYGNANPGADFVWVLDPIDGTRAFTTGKPIFGTLIALLHEGVPVLGIIDQPILRERWIGAEGHETQMNGAACRVRSCSALGEAVANLGPQALRGECLEMIPLYNRLEKACRTTSLGGDCYTYGLLASGYLDLALENDLKLYDYAALIPVVKGAGGTMTDWLGNPLGARSDGAILAFGDPRVGDAALALMRGDA